MKLLYMQQVENNLFSLSLNKYVVLVKNLDTRLVYIVTYYNCRFLN